MTNFKEKYETYRSLVEETLAKAVRVDCPKEYDVVHRAMNYSLLAGGKRLRPVILLASYDAVAGSDGYAVPLQFATAIEFIHTYSLIHDDLPCMDDDDFRRGKLSNHKMFGEGFALLAGDALLNSAYEIMNRAAEERSDSEIRRVVSAAGIIAKAAGLNGMIGGQCADILNAGGKTTINEDILAYINERKTGVLISAAFEAGAVLGGAEREVAAKFAEAGLHVGYAFQIRDDLLDATGTFETIGKPVKSDDKNNKTTYFTLLGESACANAINRETDKAVFPLRDCGVDSEFLEELVFSIKNRVK